MIYIVMVSVNHDDEIDIATNDVDYNDYNHLHDSSH